MVLINCHEETLNTHDISIAERRLALTQMELPVPFYADIEAARSGISDATVLNLHRAIERRRSALAQALAGEWIMSEQRNREIAINAAWTDFSRERDSILLADPWYPTWHARRFPR